MSTVETFRYLAVTFSMILGLGVTRILAGAISVCRSRRHAELDWIPMAWAFATFVLQLQFWWAIIELPALIEHWTISAFLLLLSVPLVLFAAAAMILPGNDLAPGDSLWVVFIRDGRLGLVFLICYAVIAAVIDFTLFSAGLVSAATAYLLLEAILPLLFLMISKRIHQSVITGAYVLTVLWSSWSLSAKYY